MSDVITVVRAKKLKNFPQPDICRGQDTRADAKLRRMKVELAKEIMELAARLVFETDLNDRIGIAKQVH